MVIRVNTRPPWQQMVDGSMKTVQLRMQSIAAHESIRMPLADIIVTATNHLGEVVAVLHWPRKELAYWVV